MVMITAWIQLWWGMHATQLQRRSVRLPSSIYEFGCFFVTICTLNRRHTLASIQSGHVHLTEVGHMVKEEWTRTPLVRPGTTLGEWIIMPDHLHGIIHLPQSRAGSLSALVRGFKSACTRRYREIHSNTNTSMWQRGYYEHVIRGEKEHGSIADYIRTNPLRWTLDNAHKTKGRAQRAPTPRLR